jgi:hypothetical protein
LISTLSQRMTSPLKRLLGLSFVVCCGGANINSHQQNSVRARWVKMQHTYVRHHQKGSQPWYFLIAT